MKVYREQDQLVLEDVDDFHPKHTFECGQCFRWEKEEDGSYTGVAQGRVINVKRIDKKTFVIKNTDMEDYHHIWRHYFDLDRDYTTIKKKLAKDEVMEKAVEFGWGIRILQQDIWECLISFIISSNNIIPRIKKIIKNISEKYGQPIPFNGKVYYSFPKPEDLYGKTLDDLAFCRSGYRCQYILDAARAVVEKQVVPEALAGYPTSRARQELMRIKGVGPKVADCILLFSAQKHEVFPTDVWIKRIIEYLYLDRNAAMNDIQAFAEKSYGDFAGFAQQYLFYYAREFKIGK